MTMKCTVMGSYTVRKMLLALPPPKCFKIDKWMDRQRQREQQIKSKQGKNVTDKSEERVGVFLDILCTIFAIFLCVFGITVVPNKTLKKNKGALGYHLV